jgi:ABC-2 type transport system permease protein
MPTHAWAILWAQWRTLRNFYPQRRGGALFSGIISLVWYAAWTLASLAISELLAEWKDVDRLPQIMSGGLLVAFVYWQLTPLLLATTGASLDLKRLLVYPVPRTQLFAIEVLLRVSTGLEMMLLMTGAAAGLLRNPVVPKWAPLAFVPFALFNLFLSAGLRDLLTRLLARKRIREAVVFLLVLLAAAPQYLAMRGGPGKLSNALAMKQSALLPWTAAGELAGGHAAGTALAMLSIWTVAAYLFGRRQFEKGLRFDAEAARAEERPMAQAGSRLDVFFRLPSKLLSDPLAAMIEKEVRFLSRAPRFRLVFLMGFSFGLIVWLPLALGRRGAPSFLSDNLLTFVSMYALLLLGDVLIWNVFAYDRAAAQLYHLAPVPFSKVLAAKNLTAAIMVLLELAMVTLVCLLLRVPLSGEKIIEAFAVTMLMLLYLIPFGNLTSTYYPRGLNPAQSWRSSASGLHVLLILVYPLAAMPLSLPYLARYAFDSDIAFYAVLPFNLAFGALLYWVALDSAVEASGRRKERMLAALCSNDGPVSLNR